MRVTNVDEAVFEAAVESDDPLSSAGREDPRGVAARKAVRERRGRPRIGATVH